MCVHVCLPPPPPTSRNHRSPQCLSQSWRVRLSECSQRRQCQRVLVPTSGLSGVRSRQPRTSLFLLCSCHREGMLSFYLTCFCRLQKTVCTLSIKIQRSVFKNSIICFCRTWLEQKPVQCRSLRTGVENHYAKS